MEGRVGEKQWHVFGGDYFYPLAFLGDYRGSFATLDEAMAEANADYPPLEGGWGGGQKYAWACIARTEATGLVRVWARGDESEDERPA